MGQQQQISPEVKAAVMALSPALVERFKPKRVLAAQLRVRESRVSRLRAPSIIAHARTHS